jgi:hypothetical protein
VVVAGDKRRSHLTYTFAQAGGDRDVEVSAIACLPEGFPTTRPADSVKLKVQRRPLLFTIETPGKSVLFGKPVQFRIQPVDQVASVAWDFDDGNSDSTNNVAPQHTYQHTGTFAVSAEVTSKDGQKLKARWPTWSSWLSQPKRGRWRFMPAQPWVIGCTSEAWSN